MRAVLLLVMAVLCGCGVIPPDLRTVSADGAGVSFEFALGEEEIAQRQAVLYCANLGRSAARESTTPARPNRFVAAFVCR